MRAASPRRLEHSDSSDSPSSSRRQRSRSSQRREEQARRVATRCARARHTFGSSRAARGRARARRGASSSPSAITSLATRCRPGTRGCSSERESRSRDLRVEQRLRRLGSLQRARQFASTDGDRGRCPPAVRDDAVVPVPRPDSRSLDLHVEQPRRGLGALERLEVRVRGRDHVAAAVAVERARGGSSRRPAGRRRPARRRGTRAPCRAGRSRVTRPVGSGPGSAVRKRIASGCLNCGCTSSSGSSSPSAIRSCTSTRSTPTAQRTRSAIWPPGIRAAHSTTSTRPSGAAISCGNAIPVSQPERVHRVRRDALRLFELVAVDRRRVDVDPADAEADAGRAQPVGERQRDRLAAAREHDPVHLHPLDELLEDRLAARRRGERLVQVRVDVVDATRRGRRRAGRPSRRA